MTGTGAEHAARPVLGSVLVLNGPNLDMLGSRDPDVYGTATLADIESMCREEADRLSLSVDFTQSNHEGTLIDRVHEAVRRGEAVVCNAGGYSHTSIALMDALAMLRTPVIEVHISNIHDREEFRRFSYVSLVADEVIVGRGVQGYLFALQAVARRLVRS
jgi:3-dehydroquinate dehydratase-2